MAPRAAPPASTNAVRGAPAGLRPAAARAGVVVAFTGGQLQPPRAARASASWPGPGPSGFFAGGPGLPPCPLAGGGAGPRPDRAPRGRAPVVIAFSARAAGV